MTEEWKSVKGFEGYYEVSNLGRVRSLDLNLPHNTSKTGTQFMKGRVKNTRLSRSGYVICDLYKNKKAYTKYVHRLVAEAFCPFREGAHEVNHKDENKQNNVYTNLEWVTHKENNNYGTKTDRGVSTRIASGMMVLVQQYSLDGVYIQTFSSLASAARAVNGDASRIKRTALKGMKYKSYGFRWKVV